MSTKLVPKAGIVLPVPVKPIHKQTSSLDVPINLDCLPFQFFQLVIWAEWASRKNDSLELAWLVSVSPQKASFFSTTKIGTGSTPIVQDTWDSTAKSSATA